MKTLSTCVEITENKKSACSLRRVRRCNPSRLLDTRNTAAMAAINTPQTIFTIIGGFKVPSVILLNIYVAESADVIRKVKINRIDRTGRIMVKGSSPYVENKALVCKKFRKRSAKNN
jgi:hypothetical protein